MSASGGDLPRRGRLAVEAFRDELAQTRAEWWANLLAPGPADRERATTAVELLYARTGRAAPEIVWCDSPLELVREAARTSGADIAADVAYRMFRRELHALAGRQTGVYRFRSHLLAELQDIQARGTSEAVWDAVFDVVKVTERPAWHAARGSVWDFFDFGDIEVGEMVQPAFAGSLALAQFLRDHWGLTHKSPAARDLVCTCGGFVLHENCALLSERHVSLRRDDAGRLHNEVGPAVSWPDGFAVHAWHGFRVAREVIESPETLEPATVVSEPNLELRRVMIEVVGYERLLVGLRLRPVAQDETGVLWRVEQPPDEPLALVEVENATPEPDGSRKHYFLRVPPEMRTAREAVAWTFGETADEYDPEVET